MSAEVATILYMNPKEQCYVTSHLRFVENVVENLFEFSLQKNSLKERKSHYSEDTF